METKTDEYVLARDLTGSTRCESPNLIAINPLTASANNQQPIHQYRLDAQHLLWKLYNGYTINPDIPISADMKIAEIGTGTG